MPLNRPDAKAIVDRTFWDMQRALGLADWKLKVEWRKLDPNTKGQARLTPRYGHGTVAFDENEHDEEKDLLRSVRHELLHVLVAEHDPLRDVAHCLADSKTEHDLVNCTEQECAERMVLQLERTLDGLGLTPAVLAKKGRPE